jgi:hypothetical protein
MCGLPCWHGRVAVLTALLAAFVPVFVMSCRMVWHSQICRAMQSRRPSLQAGKQSFLDKSVSSAALLRQHCSWRDLLKSMPHA